jgi:copper/silver efflux system protein
VIDNVKKRLAEMAGSLPEGVTIEPVYDRSTLIHAASTPAPHAAR